MLAGFDLHNKSNGTVWQVAENKGEKGEEEQVRQLAASSECW